MTMTVIVMMVAAEAGETAENNPGEVIRDQQQQAQETSATSSTPTPPGDGLEQQNDDYDTEETESELALSEPPGSPSPPVHDELSEHRPAGQ